MDRCGQWLFTVQRRVCIAEALVEAVQCLGNGQASPFEGVDRQDHEVAGHWPVAEVAEVGALHGAQPGQRLLQPLDVATPGQQLADHVNVVNLAVRRVGDLDFGALTEEQVPHRKVLRVEHRVHLMPPSGDLISR